MQQSAATLPCIQANEPWLGRVSYVYNGMYAMVLDNKQCPPSFNDQTKREISYWLKPNLPNWKLIPGQVSMVDLQLFDNSAIYIESVRVQNMATGQFEPIFSLPAMYQPGSRVEGVPASLSVPLKDLISNTDMDQRRKEAQAVLLNKFKPPLVRNLVGARGDGLGVRDPSDSEFRKEWLRLPNGSFVSVELLITDSTNEPLTTVVVHGKITETFPQSHLINGLGTVYQLEPDASVGDPKDVDTYAPIYIGRRKLRYFVCVYYDLKDCKVIVTAGTVSHSDAIEDMAVGAVGSTRLAEYLIADIKLSTEDGTQVPYPGDLEDKRFKNLVRAAKRSERDVMVAGRIAEPGDISFNTAEAVPDFTSLAVVENPVGPLAPVGQVPVAGAGGGEDVGGLNALGMRRLPGGGLEVPDIVQRFREQQARRAKTPAPSDHVVPPMAMAEL
jgi:hypothetical protein